MFVFNVIGFSFHLGAGYFESKYEANWYFCSQKGLEDYSFLPFTVMLAGFFIFTWKYVPETKNKTIDEISSIWRKDSQSEAVFEQTIDTRDE